MNGTAICNERVVIVEVDSGNVRLKTGRIASTAPVMAPGANRTEAVVRGDRRLHAMAESPEEAREQAFQVDNIHLLKEQEARALQDPDRARDWFGTIYQDGIVIKIHRALKRLKAV